MRHLPAVRAVLLLAAVLSPVVASARVPLTLRLGYAGQVSTAHAYDLVDENDHLPLFRVGAGYSFLLPTGRLEVEGGFLTGGTSAPLHQVTTARLGLVGVEAGAAYRVRVGTSFEPYAQVLVGHDWLKLELAALNQRTGQLSATALLGVSLLIPTRQGDAASSAFVVDLGVGYGFRPDARFDALAPTPPENAEEEPIRSAPLPVGSLPLSGVTYRLQVGLRL
ncbi:outer membrane beta-barrel protein [Archangium sp.]|uniref:outer membrane beta-barrel protein n=1 Tax=Archangium sp. TaxID=1872627 RepID=UPI00389B0395